MVDHYRLLKVEADECAYVSMSTDFARPDDYLEDLGKDLFKRQVKGKILFDLLLCNGMKNGRFFIAYFDGRKFESNSFLELSDITPELKSATSEFYMKHYDLVAENNILSKPQKFLIKKGRLPSLSIAG
ncbi:MAG: type II toxin-antitoxin system RnlB family antitoxin [Pseudomonadales bacterium]|nr:type II toxin-antitoxin system RnlB family antitoxin [Pseudomonadales bacterium]